MGLFSRDKPKINIQSSKPDGFSGWLKCTHCQELIHTTELEQNLNCCPKCDYHYRLSAKERIYLLVDDNSFEELFEDLEPVDSLDFVDSLPYKERIEKAQKKTGHKEAIITGIGALMGVDIAIAVMDFSFMGGSMGSVVGEKLTRLIERALEDKRPLLIVSCSGGARMQESILSLMQMAKTSSALAKLNQASIPYFSILTNPTTGGVTASFASLGDVILAEPNALIGFAGPLVIERTIGQKLPKGAQKSEFLLKHGMIDAIVNRCDMREKIGEMLPFFTNKKRDYLQNDSSAAWQAELEKAFSKTEKNK